LDISWLAGRKPQLVDAPLLRWTHLARLLRRAAEQNPDLLAAGETANHRDTHMASGKQPDKKPSGVAEALRRIEVARQLRKSFLDLSNLELATLPESLWELTSLQALYLYKNQLSTLPESLGSLTALQVLSIGYNQFTTLPKSLGSLTALQELYLYKNQLSTLPEWLGSLTALQTLSIGCNQFTTLPKWLTNLTALRTLALDGNQLTALPEWLGNFTRLQTLYLSNNQLSMLPESLGNLTNLRQLYLHGNPGLGLPDEVLGPDFNSVTSDNPAKPPREILDYYFRVRGAAGRVLGECKLIVVGRGGAGKTSLVKRLGGQPYDPKERETHGITIQPLRFKGERGPVTSRTWDFGGQVVLHSMHEFFLTARSLYLLVLGERDDMLERDAAYWLQLIRSYAGNAPVVVALNKSAGRQRQFDRATLEKNYGPILGWVATECSEQDPVKSGITELQRALTAALDSEHMESVRRKFPAKWFAIKDALESMKESFLDYRDFKEKCNNLGEPDEKEQAALAGDLHDLGVALNYGRDPRLRDTTVLRPDWLANGIYAVLRANDLDNEHLPTALNVPMAPDGIVDAESLRRIHAKAEAWEMLRMADYPPDKQKFLLRLMDAFHLSYPLDGNTGRMLVPTLLPLNPPAGADEPESPERSRLRYEFQVVPAPLLPWFIARTFSLIPNRLHWRRGAILAYGQARARVWTTQDERYVYATVSGASEDRDELLTMIRGTFTELFKDYRGLQVTEQWELEGEWVPRRTLEQFGKLPREQEAGIPVAHEALGDAKEDL
jgi:internalin A